MFTFAPAPKSKKPLGYLFALSATAIVLAFGSTLAANININTGPIEFGQGLVQTVACGGSDASLTITPYAEFVNVNASGNYVFTHFTVSDIPSFCDGATFTFKFYGMDSSTLTPTGESYSGEDPGTNIIVFFATSSNGAVTTGAGYLAQNTDFTVSNKSASSFTVDIAVNPGIDATELKSITVETGGSTNALVYGGHYYQYITEPVTWNDAYDAISGCYYTMELNGQTLCGYFATINSQSENDYLVNKVYDVTGENLDAWFGAADAGGRGSNTALYGGWAEGTWRWVMGPQAGQILDFTNWSENEPNNVANGEAGTDSENVTEIYGKSTTWNDLNQWSPNWSLGYLVEFSSDFLVP